VGDRPFPPNSSTVNHEHGPMTRTGYESLISQFDGTLSLCGRLFFGSINLFSTFFSVCYFACGGRPSFTQTHMKQQVYMTRREQWSVSILDCRHRLARFHCYLVQQGRPVGSDKSEHVKAPLFFVRTKAAHQQRYELDAGWPIFQR
jgi:hypothetical protein